jgi:hypothetical protein
MKKITSMTVVMMLLFLFLLSGSVLSITYCSESSMIWGSKKDQEPAEYNRAGNLTYGIMTYFSMYGSYEWTLWGYGSTTTQANVYSCTSSSNNNYDTAVVFHTGHGFKYPWGTFDHYYYYSNDYSSSANGIKDADIYQRTGNGNHYFVFLWVCTQGNEIRNSTAAGAAGMPYAWHHTDDLSDDGYNDPYGDHCFIGWRNTSKPLSESEGTYNFGDFVQVFYYYALNGDTIITALDKASEFCWDSYPDYWDSFDEVEPLYDGYDCPNPHWPDYGPETYWSKMAIYGDGYYVLP